MSNSLVGRDGRRRRFLSAPAGCLFTGRGAGVIHAQRLPMEGFADTQRGKTARRVQGRVGTLSEVPTANGMFVQS